MVPRSNEELHYSRLLNVFWKALNKWCHSCSCVCVYLVSVWALFGLLCVFFRSWKARPSQPEHDGGCWIWELSRSGQSEAAGGQYSPWWQWQRDHYFMKYLSFQTVAGTFLAYLRFKNLLPYKENTKGKIRCLKYIKVSGFLCHFKVTFIILLQHNTSSDRSGCTKIGFCLHW